MITPIRAPKFILEGKQGKTEANYTHFHPIINTPKASEKIFNNTPILQIYRCYSEVTFYM